MSYITKAQKWEIAHGRLIVINLLPFHPLITSEYANAAIFYIMLRQPGFIKPTPLDLMKMEPERAEVIEAVKLVAKKHKESGAFWPRVEWDGLYPLFVWLAKTCAKCSGDANNANYLARTAHKAMTTYKNRVEKLLGEGDAQ